MGRRLGFYYELVATLLLPALSFGVIMLLALVLYGCELALTLTRILTLTLTIALALALTPTLTPYPNPSPKPNQVLYGFELQQGRRADRKHLAEQVKAQERAACSEVRVRVP